MTTRIDEYLSARFQACCLNYNQIIKELFGSKYGIDKHLSFSLQFSTISEEHANQLKKFTDLPANIASYINDFDDTLSDADYNNIRYSYRVLYVQKSANNKGQADKVIEFLPPNSPESETLNKEYVLIKEREKVKYLPTEIWQTMRDKGYIHFGQHQHTELWKQKDAKNPALGYGTTVVNAWYWYDKWLKEVEKHCKESGNKYK